MQEDRVHFVTLFLGNNYYISGTANEVLDNLESSTKKLKKE